MVEKKIKDEDAHIELRMEWLFEHMTVDQLLTTKKYVLKELKKRGY